MKTASLTWSPPVAAGGRAQEVPDHIIPELECGREEAHDDQRQEKHEEPRDDDLPFFIVDALVSLYIDVCHAARSARQSRGPRPCRKRAVGHARPRPGDKAGLEINWAAARLHSGALRKFHNRKNPPSLRLPTCPRLRAAGLAPRCGRQAAADPIFVKSCGKSAGWVCASFGLHRLL